jgi:hypothetical protein
MAAFNATLQLDEPAEVVQERIVASVTTACLPPTITASIR